MSGSRVLRAILVALVLLDVVFVQLTEAAAVEWLAPLYGATLAAPLLERWRERLLYRTLWNAAVVGVFGILIKHVTDHDPSYVLQDGLLLAAMCQVHLLNNLRPGQSTDLLFVNSFLIAAVTGYLSNDIVFPIAFAVYVPLLVLGLALAETERAGQDPDASTTRRLAVDAARRSVGLLAVTLLVFLFWPRDFRRPGWLAAELAFDGPRDSLEVGFSEELRLDRGGGDAAASREPVLHVRVLAGPAYAAPPLWRGATLVATDGNQWWPARSGDGFAGSGDDWYRQGASIVRERGEARARIAIEHLDEDSERLFTVLEAGRVELGPGLDARLVRGRSDGTLAYEAVGARPERIGYELTLGAAAGIGLGGSVPDELRPELVRFTSLPRTRTVELAQELAQRVGGQTGKEGQHLLVERLASYLSRTRTYAMPGSEGAARNLRQFLDGAGGHCEYFASALAVLLRTSGVPCRVVTGYRGGEWDVEGRVLTIRRRDAHAWVEVFDPQGGWYAVDAVPARSSETGRSWWQMARAELGSVWRRITSFDAQARVGALAWLRGRPAATLAWAREEPAASGCIAFGMLALVVLRRRRRSRRADAATRAYLAALRRAHVQRQAGETPRETLERARGAGIAEEDLASLSAATERHERQRYGAAAHVA